MAQPPSPTHPLRATVGHVAFAVVAMGGWAAFANRDHGLQAMGLAFAAQGLLSGLITLLIKRWLEWAHARLRGPAAPLLPPLASCATVAALLTGVHTAVGTPEVLATVAVPWTVSTLYAFAYALSLERK
ncbi:MAG TPA: hypothetical protein VGR32_09355 [Brevundimonas sp.]|jgi:hypothetical protein|uniref:hypothetical protein n=1 Tax=Brevundimonas sp. TaxID=1871086 RepID=UPI002DEE3B92|nr:hypothetical protein [Brevundimonas sp.]